MQSAEDIIKDIEIKIWTEINESIEETVDVSYV